MTFEIFKGFPPERDGPIAQLIVRRDQVVDVPAEIYRTDGELRLTLFAREGGPAWEYPLNAFIDAVNRAVEALDG